MDVIATVVAVVAWTWLGILAAALLIRGWFWFRWVIPLYPPRWERWLLVMASAVMQRYLRGSFWTHRVYGWALCCETLGHYLDGLSGDPVYRLFFVSATLEELQPHTYRYRLLTIVGAPWYDNWNEFAAAPNWATICPTPADAERQLLVEMMKGNWPVRGNW